MLKRKIDENGYFVEDVLTEESNSNLIESAVPEGFYKPRWDGTQWIEGLTQTEIDAIKNKPQEPSTLDRISALEDALTSLMGV